MFDHNAGAGMLKRLTEGFSVLAHRKLVLFICVLILLIPFPTTVIPEWKVRVRNAAGNPLSGVWVRQAWKHYSLDLDSGENFDEKWTDEHGYVVFARKTITKGVLHRAFLIGITSLLSLAHGSTGRSGSVWAVTDKCSSEFLRFEPAKQLPDEIVLRCSE